MRWRILAASGLIAVLIAILARTVSDSDGAKPAALAAGELVAFAQFGPTFDTIYESSPSGLGARRKLAQIAHAPEFGIVPAASPDGRSFAYTVLPPSTVNPAPDAPAELWVAALADDTKPRRLGEGFDLLVKPLWAADGHSLVVRRDSADGGYELVRVDTATGAAAGAARSAAALFPVGFTTDLSALYYVTVDLGGTELRLFSFAANTSSFVARLSDGLTREWVLSPSGRSVAFLALGASAGATSRLQVLDLDSGLVIPSAAQGDEFGPAWTPSGEITIGRLTRSAATTGVYTQSGPVGGLEKGFDVPLMWSRSAASIAVRTFDGSSLSAPGAARLDVIAANGNRNTIATGEVTFIGWTYR